MNELASNPQGEDESVRAAATDALRQSETKADETEQSQDPVDSDDGDDDDGETENEIEHAREIPHPEGAEERPS